VGLVEYVCSHSFVVDVLAVDPDFVPLDSMLECEYAINSILLSINVCCLLVRLLYN
jgi:hypothetical protein